MTDREKLLALYNRIQDIELPEFDNKDLQVIVNTISEGIKIILGWLADSAKKHFGNDNR